MIFAASASVAGSSAQAARCSTSISSGASSASSSIACQYAALLTCAGEVEVGFPDRPRALRRVFWRLGVRPAGPHPPVTRRLAVDVRQRVDPGRPQGLRVHRHPQRDRLHAGQARPPLGPARRERTARRAQKHSDRATPGRQSTDVLLRALAERHPDLGDHLNGVTELAAALAQRLGIDGEELTQLRHAAALHDVGKVAIPDDIINKPAALSEDEWAFMRRHTLIGERILAAAPALGRAARLVRASHEAFDGSGYPDGLAGADIPLGARIIAICDAFDAMISDRPYSRPKTATEALAELRRCAGTQFDPAIVPLFEQLIAEPAQPLVTTPA